MNAISHFKYWNKSRVQWLKYGDTNSSSFMYASIIARHSGNIISSLISSTGDILVSDMDIKGQVLEFYKSLLSSCKDTLLGVDRNVINVGVLLKNEHRRVLIKAVTSMEIDDVIQAIYKKSAPGLDGLNAFFLEKYGI